MSSSDFKSDPSFKHEYFKAKPITGKVTDDKGEPLAGVTVQVKGKATGTKTGEDGSFSIGIPAGAAPQIVDDVGGVKGRKAHRELGAIETEQPLQEPAERQQQQ